MNGLNRKFKSNPKAFLQRILLITRPDQMCPTCHCAMDLSRGNIGEYNPYARPEARAMKFDLIGGAYAGGINGGKDLNIMLDYNGPALPQPTGLAIDHRHIKYAMLQPIRVGVARGGRRVGIKSNVYKAYWLPWANQGVKELQLTDRSVKFFFTAMFSGCSFSVATPPGRDAARQVWVTHIAYNPGQMAPDWWGGQAFVAGQGTDGQRRVGAEKVFYATRSPHAGCVVRTVTSDRLSILNLPGGANIGTVPLTSGVIPAGHKRYCYKDWGQVVIVGWRDGDDHWHFAVQEQPTGHYPTGHRKSITNNNILPLAVRQLY